ncbi:MAG: PIN domain-containing protein [Bacteroidales bacterium]|nr:PIN domain-containing protein [Bacteroidales bacterium]
MKGFLLDTNICIFALRGDPDVVECLRKHGQRECYVSDITVMELRYGAYRSARVKANLAIVNTFLEKMRIVPYAVAIDIFCREKVRLQQIGMPLEDYDLLIGAAAIAKGLTLVTHNVKHFERIEGLIIEDWVNL